ncbi:MAG: hypothetical protein HETSPECPRED_007203 [Heterodermia speciosa]|uniref:Zn(2)-C6 fungal-type domain-containing protein n=1 Tax=Heterodermia speciosa TaxID=116794 RepID=A0A8H3EP60_9LECA|nr:MAG: hypothetical protein HETSPECPRED_007203 [Heterodermia speciosa]
MGSSLTQAEAASLGIKLRESCDACLTAKVKCGKGRPMCQRCLTNGSDCAYSPSARAGRKNRNSTGGIKKSGSNTTSHKRPVSIDIPKNAAPSPTSTQWPSHVPPYDAGHHALEKSNCNNVSSSMAPNMTPRNTQFYSTTTPPLTSEDEALDMNAGQHGIPITSDADDNNLYNLMPTPPFHQNEFPHDFSHLDGPVSATSTLTFPEFDISSPSSHTKQTFGTNAWINQDAAYGSIPTYGNLDSSFFEIPNAISNPSTQNHPDGHIPSQHLDILAGGCDCFADCLHTLKDLHLNSWARTTDAEIGPQFDVVLKSNNAAITASNKMLTCTACSTKGGIGISAMLMATMFGKVLSLYRAAVFDRFGPTASSRDMQSPASLAFGAYEVSGDDRHLLEIEILLFELKKVEKTMNLWHDRSQVLSADKDVNSVYEALAMYLDKNLHHVTEFLRDVRLQMCQ